MSIRADNITAGYEEPVVKEVQASARSGELTVILGPNGSGKTTLLKTLSGLLEPFKGKVYLDGVDLYRVSRASRAKLASYLPPSIARGIDTTTVFDLLLAARIPHSTALWLKPSKRDLSIISRVVDILGLKHLVSRRLVSLSSGELQRVLIAFSLVKEARAILADEPTAFLDLYYKINVFSLLKKLAEEGRAVLVATHEIFIAPRFADTILLIKNGVIVAKGKPADVLTPRAIREVFGVDVRIQVHDGRLTVVV